MTSLHFSLVLPLQCFKITLGGPVGIPELQGPSPMVQILAVASPDLEVQEMQLQEFGPLEMDQILAVASPDLEVQES